MDEINKKRKIIYENNEFVCEYSEIIRILNENSCKYTSNQNGIFLNLTTTSDDVIEEIYPFFVNNTLQKYDDSNPNTDTSTYNNMFVPKKRTIHKIKKTYSIQMDGFSEKEKKVIRESYNYHL